MNLYSRHVVFAVLILDSGCYGKLSKVNRGLTKARVDELQIKTSALFCSCLF